MVAYTTTAQPRIGSWIRKGLIFAGLVAWLGIASRAICQHPSCETNAGFPPPLPLAPQQPPRPATGPNGVSSFLEGLSSPDGGIEILVGEGRVLTTKTDIASGKKPALVAVGDPMVLDFIVVNSRQIRLVGLRVGVTDLSLTTSNNETYSFEVRVVPDLNVLRGQLRCVFPDALLKLGLIRDNVVVEGQARDPAQVARILETIKSYLLSVHASEARQSSQRRSGGSGVIGQPPVAAPGTTTTPGTPAGFQPPGTYPAAAASGGGGQGMQGDQYTPQIINLIKVPGPQQVLLKVRIAELNRTAMRQIGADFLALNPHTGAIVGSQIGGATVTGTGTIANRILTGTASDTTSAVTTLFGIFEQGDFEVFFSALRQNSLVKILAEPNLVAMNGQQANFLAGGQFPVPVPQVGAAGVAPTVTVQFQPFGVLLSFVPFILDDEVIRLTVDPEVSTIDKAIGTTLVAGGTPVPGLDTRKAHTVVELHQGQTLAIAGLLQLTVDNQTNRIPGLGDLPILGPFFSNTTGNRVEKELIVLVTPYLVNSMNHDQVSPGPGDEVKEPNDLEFYLLNRIEGRTDQSGRSTTLYDDPLFVLRTFLKLENDHVRGPHGYCE